MLFVGSVSTLAVGRSPVAGLKCLELRYCEDRMPPLERVEGGWVQVEVEVHLPTSQLTIFDIIALHPSSDGLL